MILDENGANLAYLIWFCFRAIALKVWFLFYTFFPEDVMAALYSFVTVHLPQPRHRRVALEGHDQGLEDVGGLFA